MYARIETKENHCKTKENHCKTNDSFKKQPKTIVNPKKPKNQKRGAENLKHYQKNKKTQNLETLVLGPSPFLVFGGMLRTVLVFLGSSGGQNHCKTKKTQKTKREEPKT